MSGRATLRAAIPAALLTISMINASFVSADTRTWAPPVVGSGGSVVWTNATNWGGTVPIDMDLALFNQATYNFAPNAGTATVGGLQIGDGTVAATLTLSGTSLTLGSLGITKSPASGATTISSPTVIGTAQTWANNSTTVMAVSGAVNTNALQLTVGGSGNTTITGLISGTGSLLKTGTGTLTIGAGTTPNSFSGGTIIQQGNLTLAGSNAGSTTGSNLAAGTGSITLGSTGGTDNVSLTLAGVSGTIINANPLTVSSGTGTRTIQSANNVSYTGPITLNSDLILNQTSTNSLTINTPASSTGITGSSNIIVQSTGTGLVIIDGAGGAGNPNFTGNLQVKTGTVRFGNGSSLRPIFSANNQLMIQSGATVDQRNSATLTFAGISDLNGGGGTLTNGSGGPGSVNVGGSGNYSFSGAINNGNAGIGVLNFNAYLNGGTQTLAGTNGYTGVTSLYTGMLAVANITNGGVAGNLGAANSSAGSIVLGGGTLKYTGAGSTTDRLFTVTANGGSINASGTGALVFGSTGTINTADPNLLANRSVIFTAGSANATFSNGVTDLAIGMTVNAAGNIPAGTTVVAINYSNNTVTLSSPATTGGTNATTSVNNFDRTLTLTGTNTAANTIAGALTDSITTAKLGIAKTGAGTWVLSGANTYSGVTTIQAGTLKLAGTAGTNALNNTGGVDVRGGKVQFDSSNFASIKSTIVTGYNQPTQFSSGQIRSSTLAANRVLGYADDGVNTTVMYTVPGDADLNGVVDFNDFLVLQNNFNNPDTTFGQGNFDFNGITDFNDFLVLQNHFGDNLTGAAASPLMPGEVAAIQAFAATVPEPSSVMAIALAAGGLLRRRRAV